MKKITFTIMALSLFSIGFVKAQALDTIPNGDFERWNGLTQTKAQPQGWDTLSGISYPVTEVDYEKGSQIVQRHVYDGKYALSLASQAFPNNTFSYGAIECKFSMKHRDPYLDMNLAYFEAVAPQSPEFILIFWNSTTHDTLVKVGAYFQNVNTANDTLEPWSPYSINIPYPSADPTIPDSGIIFVSNFLNLQGAAITPLSVLYIEKMWFDNAAAAGISTEMTSNNNPVNVYPNPFTNKTAIHYSLAQSGLVNLTVYDMQGKEIRTLVNTNQSVGTYNETFDGNGLSNGVYFYKLMTSTGVQTGKLILSK